MKKNTYLMWENGPTITLPKGFHWDSKEGEVVKNDLSWRGDLVAWFKYQATERVRKKAKK